MSSAEVEVTGEHTVEMSRAVAARRVTDERRRSGPVAADDVARGRRVVDRTACALGQCRSFDARAGLARGDADARRLALGRPRAVTGRLDLADVQARLRCEKPPAAEAGDREQLPAVGRGPERLDVHAAVAAPPH